MTDAGEAPLSRWQRACMEEDGRTGRRMHERTNGRTKSDRCGSWSSQTDDDYANRRAELLTIVPAVTPCTGYIRTHIHSRINTHTYTMNRKFPRNDRSDLPISSYRHVYRIARNASRNRIIYSFIAGTFYRKLCDIQLSQLR